MSEHADRQELPGVIVARRGELLFLGSDMAERIVERPVISRVPGTDIGMALVLGRVTSVVELGEGGGELLLCNVGGESIALSGLSVVGAGFYEVDGQGVKLADAHVPRLDVEHELGRIEGRLIYRQLASDSRKGGAR
jgi:hypothetical protein